MCVMCCVYICALIFFFHSAVCLYFPPMCYGIREMRACEGVSILWIAEFHWARLYSVCVHRNFSFLFIEVFCRKIVRAYKWKERKNERCALSQTEPIKSQYITKSTIILFYSEFRYTLIYWFIHLYIMKSLCSVCQFCNDKNQFYQVRE